MTTTKKETKVYKAEDFAPMVASKVEAKIEPKPEVKESPSIHRAEQKALVKRSFLEARVMLWVLLNRDELKPLLSHNAFKTAQEAYNILELVKEEEILA